MIFHHLNIIITLPGVVVHTDFLPPFPRDVAGFHQRKSKKVFSAPLVRIFDAFLKSFDGGVSGVGNLLLIVCIIIVIFILITIKRIKLKKNNAILFKSTKI